METWKQCSDAVNKQVSCGPSFCLAITGGNVWSWGTGEGFVLGHGDTIKRDTPLQIEAFKGSAVLQVRCLGGKEGKAGEKGVLSNAIYNQSGPCNRENKFLTFGLG